MPRSTLEHPRHVRQQVALENRPQVPGPPGLDLLAVSHNMVLMCPEKHAPFKTD